MAGRGAEGRAKRGSLGDNMQSIWYLGGGNVGIKTQI